jgi:VanZ family protein
MNKDVLSVTVISILIYAILIPLSYFHGTQGFVPELILFMAVGVFFAWMYNTLKLNIPILTMLHIGLILHSFGIFGWYYISPIPIAWERITHFFGILPMAMMFYKWMSQFMDTKLFTKRNLFAIITVFFAATGVGALVEVGEFVGYLTLGHGEGALMFGPGDSIGGSDVINEIGGGWINASWDMIFNALGAITAIIIMLFTRLLYKKPTKAYYFEPIENFSRKL